MSIERQKRIFTDLVEEMDEQMGKASPGTKQSVIKTVTDETDPIKIARELTAACKAFAVGMEFSIAAMILNKENKS